MLANNADLSPSSKFGQHDIDIMFATHQFRIPLTHKISLKATPSFETHI